MLALTLNLNRTVVARVRRILGWTGGGVHKRIDENIELLELLRDRAPAFLEQHPWVVNWFESHDEFLRQLASAMPLKEGFYLHRATCPDAGFPRAFPCSGTPKHNSEPSK